MYVRHWLGNLSHHHTEHFKSVTFWMCNRWERQQKKAWRSDCGRSWVQIDEDNAILGRCYRTAADSDLCISHAVTSCYPWRWWASRTSTFYNNQAQKGFGFNPPHWLHTVLELLGIGGQGFPFPPLLSWFASASLANPYCQSMWMCVCLCVCLSGTSRSNISETKGARGSVTMGSL